MAPEKRKAGSDARPNKRPRPNGDKPGQRVQSTKTNDGQTGERKPLAKSVLLQEERSFPRGGASVLSPLEQKQVRAQAERDVLFEQSTGKKAPRLDDEDGIDETEPTAARPSKKRRKDQKTADSAPKDKSQGSKIHGLSYKTLVPGSLVLAKLNGRIEALLDDDADKDSDDDVDLKQIFHIGQWLRAVVTEPSQATAANKRHIELSIDPAQVNAQLEADNVVTNCYIQASIRSIEDHGIIMDLGLSSSEIKGFVSKKELGFAYKLEELEEGQVMLCIVTGKGSGGSVVKLSPDAARFWATSGGKHSSVVTDVPDVEALVPGLAIDVLITSASAGGITGKLMGMVDVMADALHSGAGLTSTEDFLKQQKIGSKTRARIIWSLPTDEGNRKIGISLLPHLLTMPPQSTSLGPSPPEKARSQAKLLEHSLPLSSVCEHTIVTGVVSDRGLYLDVNDDAGVSIAKAFAHISQVSDTRIDELATSTGKFMIGSKHRARIIGFNPVDALYYVSLQESVLAQAFLRLEDLQVGQAVDGKVERLILGGASGLTGVVIKLSGNITALVPALHMSDVALQHPERKFREGFAVKGRVLSIDTDKRQARVTLKKTLVNDQSADFWQSYSDLSVGQEAKGTVVKLLDKGALVQYYGQIRAFLPVSEMSEAFVESPAKHFKLGQTVNTRILQIDAENEQLRVSCKAAGGVDDFTQQALNNLQPGQIVSGSVTALLADKIEVEIEGGVQGIVRTGHLVDGSASKAESMQKKLRVGQKLNELVVLSKLERSSQVVLSYKSSFVNDAKVSKLVTSFEDATVGRKVHGYVQNVTPEGVYVEFANHVVALLPKVQLLPELLAQASFGLRRDQTVSAWVLNVDQARERFALTMREGAASAPVSTPELKTAVSLNNAADPNLKSTADLTLGKVTKAIVASVKGTQVNVRLDDSVQGRVDVSEVFDSWDEIKNTRNPLQDSFKVGQVIDVTVLGIRDARGYRFLPFSHRGRGNTMIELSAKASRRHSKDKELLNGMEDVQEGVVYTAFVNNTLEDCIWVNLSPSIRGKIAIMNLSRDAGRLQDLPKAFPTGSALRVRVLRVDAAKGQLDLTARLDETSEPAVTIETLTAGEIIPGRVTKSGSNSVIVQLADNLAAPVSLVELADDFDQANPVRFSKNEIVRVRILSVDTINKRLSLSLRPSLVLSSSLPIKDAHISNLAQVRPNTLARGFVKRVTEKGVVVALSGTVDAFVRVADLSDDYVKDWKSLLEIDQLVSGRILEVDAASKHIRLSLKASQTDANYVSPNKLEDLEVGSVVTGKVRKVEEFGVFIDIDGTQPRLSGLAHRSEVAERRVNDVRGLYSPGDVVKAKILKIDVEARKISLGLKASYFKQQEDNEESDDDDDGIAIDDVSEDELEEDGGIDLSAVQDVEESDVDAMDVDIEEDDVPQSKGLTTTGFDWTGDDTGASNGADYESEPELAPKKKRTKAEIKIDMTGDLDKYGPRSTSDFERQLLGQPNDSGLWIQYMALHLELSEIQKARDIAERALRTIHIRDMDEKANIWIALLNLEVEYGDEESVEDAFKKACQVQEPLGMHEKMASIYIDAGKHDKADAIFERIIGNKTFRASPEVWLNYATFLLSQLRQPERAHALLPRALQSVSKSEHRLLTAKFAALEFRTTSGDAERGRTIFEGLMSEWPKWTAGWDMWVDIERARAQKDGTLESLDRVRKLYERISQAGMKKKRAKFVFKKWLEFEEAHGSVKGQDRVKASAREFVEKLQSKNDDEEE
ncbi:hypothetical protein AMS68_000024 [Peltaster fructicola]|uniref:rRNA biogenesis protein RRP5 n=1 Tax=Peltaster fructicola TaxID=286661 RepID=A0A6H0XIG1_9PEZI|nr:hypothetical protein AMS68_000024 [Peltaster fructicola]